MGFFANLFDAFSKPGLTDPVQGTAQVVSSSMPPYHSRGGGMCVMNLVITIPGQPSVAVRKASIVKLSQWPMPGAILPVLAERTDPRRYAILWDRISSGAESGAERARQIADRLNAGDRAEPGASGHRSGMHTSITVNGQPATSETIAALEAMTGMDLNGDGRVAGRGTTSAGQEGAQDAEDRLRHLRSLRDGGLIDDAEYRAKRADILSGL